MHNIFCTLHVRRSPQAVPLAAGCLTAALDEPYRQKTRLLDFYPDNRDQDIVRAVLAEPPVNVLFPVYVWNRQRICRIARLIHEQMPSVSLICGGPEATGDPGGLINQAPWTALITGEGEDVLQSLLQATENNQKLQSITGLVLPNTPFPQMNNESPDLKTIASPWLENILHPTSDGGVLWEVARGCAFSCDYCFDARGHSGVRQIPQERLEAELDLFVERGVSQVWVLDSTFNYPPERGVALLKMLHNKAPQMHYHLEAKADFLDRQTIALLGRLNCSLQIGLQSVHENVLHTIHRPVDLSVLAEKIHWLEMEGVIYGFDLIYGLPGDNYEGFKKSLDTTLAFAPNHVHIFPLSVLPGTRLAQQKDRYGMQSQDLPPYEILSSDDWTEEELMSCRHLSAAVDLFYNTGRAVVFLPTVLDTLQTSSGQLFEGFYDWLLQQPDLSDNDLMDASRWSAEDAYRMLQLYLSRQLRESGQGHLVSVILDLLCYHYHYGETLVGEELPLPEDDVLVQDNPWTTPWQRSARIRLVPFAYEILDLLEMEEMQLDEIANLFRPVGSVALFIRRDNEVFCESLGEEMLKLLKHSDGQKSPESIFAGSISRDMGEELVLFALGEGLLHPPQTAFT